jgi:hypothetical protein
MRPSIRQTLVVGLALSLGLGAGLTIARAATAVTYQQDLNRGLANALNNVLGNTLGAADGSAQIVPPALPPGPYRLVLHFNADSVIPVDIVFFRGGALPPSLPPGPYRPCDNVTVFSVENGTITAQAAPGENLTLSGNENLNALPPGPYCPVATDSAP